MPRYIVTHTPLGAATQVTTIGPSEIGLLAPTINALVTGAWPDNEPSSFSVVLNANGSTKYYLDDYPTEAYYGAKWQDSSRVTVVSDAGARYGGQCIEKRFLEGDGDGWNGTAILNNFTQASGAPFSYCRYMYIRLIFKFASNWQFHGSGAHKIILFGKQGTNAANSFTINARGTADPMKAQLTNQSGSAGAASGLWISDQNPLSLGNWHTLELYIIAQSTTATSDGSFRMWVDGNELTFNRGQTGLQWLDSSEVHPDNQWDGIQTFLYWGGSGGTWSTDSWIRISEVYLSGAND